jgi:TP901 family phage tail tape measure protein
MVGFTLPLAAFGAAAAKSFQQLETEVIKFRKVYGDLGTNAIETEAALKNIQDLADGYTKYGVAVAKTVGVASAAAAAGFQGADLLAQTEAATKLAILGQIDQQQALETTISLQNAFKISSTELASTIDFLNSVENQTVTSLDDITTAIPKVAPVIQQLGGDVKDLAFFLTAMKEGGVNASEGANALKSGLASLINPSKKANDMLASMGININNIVTKNRGNLKATVVEFAKELDKLDPLSRARAIETMFGKFQFARISTLLSNVIDTGNQASRVLDLAGKSVADLAGLTEKELGITAESALIRFQGAVAKLQASLAPVGEVFMNALVPVLDFISGILDKFNNLGDGTKKFIAITVGVIGGLGPVLLMTFGLLANGIANILKLFATLRAGYQRLTGQSQSLGAQTQYLTTEQMEATAAAHSLQQSHARLTQQFTVEATAVNSLRAAYQQALAAGASFASLNPGMMRAPKKFATGGIFKGPGNGTSDSIPAMVSNGEAIIPAKTVRQYPGMVAGLVAGKIPGFATGLSPSGKIVMTPSEGKDKTNLFKATDVIKPQTTAATWKTMNAEMSAMAAAAEKYLKELGFGSKDIQNKINQLVQKQASHITQQIQQVEVAGKSVNVKLWNADNLITDFGGINNYLNSIHKVTGSLSQNNIAEMAAKLKISIPELETELKKLNDGIHPTTRRAGQVVSELAGIGSTSSDKTLAYQSRSVKAGMDVRLGGDYYETVKDRAYDPKKDLASLQQTQKNIIKLKTELLNSFDISQEIVSLSGKNKAALQSAWSQLSIQAKERLMLLSGDTRAFTVGLMDEAKAAGLAGFQIGSAVVKGVAQGAMTASDSKATQKTAKDIINGLRNELARQEAAVRQSGLRVGQIAVQSIDAGVVSATKKRRFSQRPQGPAPIGPLMPVGATMLPIVTPLTRQEKFADRYQKTKTKFADGYQNTKEKVGPPNLKPSVRGLGGGMGLMGASMAMSALPGFAGKEAIQSTLNLASMGAMFGPYGAAAGAALGLVTGAIGELKKAQAEYNRNAKADFTQSAAAISFMGGKVVDVTDKFRNLKIVITGADFGLKSTAESASQLSEGISYTSEQLSGFKTMVESLPEDNALAIVMKQIENASSDLSAANIASDFVTMQMAINGISQEQANTLQQLILTVGGKDALAATTPVATQIDAIKESINSALPNATAFAQVMGQLSNLAINTNSYETFQDIISGIGSSAATSEQQLRGLYDYFSGQSDSGSANAVQALINSGKGFDATDFDSIAKAIKNGYDVVFEDLVPGKVADQLSEQIKKPTKERQVVIAKIAKIQKQIKDASDGTTAATIANSVATAKNVNGLKKQQVVLDAKLKKLQNIQKVQNQISDFESKKQDLQGQIALAKASGDYLKAQQLQQQLIQATQDFYTQEQIDKASADAEANRQKLEAAQLAVEEARQKATEGNTSAITDLNVQLKTYQGELLALVGELKIKYGTDTIPNKNLKENQLLPNAGTQVVDPKTKQLVDVGGPDGPKAKDPNLPIPSVSKERAYHPMFPHLKPVQPKYGGIWATKKYYDKTTGLTFNPVDGWSYTADGKPFAQWATTNDYGVLTTFATGGHVKGPGTPTSDSIPAYLSDGEYVVKASSVAKYGTGFMDHINAGKFANGGLIGNNEMVQGYSLGGIVKDLIASGIKKIGGLFSKKAVSEAVSPAVSSVPKKNVTPKVIKDIDQYNSSFVIADNMLPGQEASKAYNIQSTSIGVPYVSGTSSLIHNLPLSETELFSMYAMKESNKSSLFGITLLEALLRGNKLSLSSDRSVAAESVAQKLLTKNLQDYIKVPSRTASSVDENTFGSIWNWAYKSADFDKGYLQDGLNNPPPGIRFSSLNQDQISAGSEVAKHIFGSKNIDPVLMKDYLQQYLSAGNRNFANGGMVNIPRFGEGTPGGLNVKKILSSSPARGFGAGAVWQGMEDLESWLSVKFGADKNASAEEKALKGYGRYLFDIFQGGVTGLAQSRSGAGGLAGLFGGAIEGAIGIAQSGGIQQFGVKGGSKAKDPNFDPKKEEKKYNILNTLGNMMYSGAVGGGLNPITDKIGAFIGPKIKNLFTSKKPGDTGIANIASVVPKSEFPTPPMFGGTQPKIGSILPGISKNPKSSESVIQKSIDDYMETLDEFGRTPEQQMRYQETMQLRIGTINKYRSGLSEKQLEFLRKTDAMDIDDDNARAILERTRALGIPDEAVGIDFLKRYQDIPVIGRSAAFKQAVKGFFVKLKEPTDFYRGTGIDSYETASVNARDSGLPIEIVKAMQSGKYKNLIGETFKSQQLKSFSESSISAQAFSLSGEPGKIGAVLTIKNFNGKTIPLSDMLGDFVSGKMVKPEYEHLIQPTLKIKDIVKDKFGTFQITAEGFKNGGMVNIPKFHNWNGVVPGQYGQELNAVLKSGTEGVYQNEYIAGLKNAASGNTSTSNANTVYNIDMTVNGGTANANDIANQVMKKLQVVASQNNKSNKVVI